MNSQVYSTRARSYDMTSIMHLYACWKRCKRIRAPLGRLKVNTLMEKRHQCCVAGDDDSGKGCLERARMIWIFSLVKPLNSSRNWKWKRR